ncbi:MAG: hypothetical protein IKW45_05285 [Clostridia bacterium]|nr:hypothetical protein [Clostridia bacterium]
MEYASKGMAGTALGFGIAGATLGAANSGLLNNIFGGMNTRGECAEDHFVNRYEANQAARIAELETEVKLRDANTYTDNKLLELYKYVDGKFGFVEQEICAQRVYNATNTSAIACINNQIAVLNGLTKTVISADNVCPAPMPQYNSWTAPTATT